MPLKLYSKKSDPANIYKSQKKFFKCISSRTAAIAAYLYQQLDSRQNDSDDPYQQMFNQTSSPNLLVPALAASIYNDLQNCIKTNLTETYKTGVFFFLKQMEKEKTDHNALNLTIERSLTESDNLIKAALVNLCAKLYSKAQLSPETLKSEINKLVQNFIANVALTETMRQKVNGAVDSLKENGIKKVSVMAEYRTAGDDHVCPKCEAYERKIMTLDEVKALLPQHPRCRCWFSIVDEDN